MATEDGQQHEHATLPVADDEYGFAGRSRDQITAVPATLADQYLVLMVQSESPDTREGAALAMAVETAVRTHGGEPVSLPPAWVPEAAEGWRATYDESVDVLLIDMPHDIVFYKGSLSAAPEWVLGAIAAESVVLVTGAVASLDEVQSLLDSGKASQVRIPLQVKMAR